MSTSSPKQKSPRRGLPWGQHRGLAVLCAMGVLALVLLVLSIFGEQGIFRIRSLGRDRITLLEKVRSIESDNTALRRQLQDMKDGRASYELAAREKLGMVKPGEVVYDFRTDPTVSPAR